MDQLIELLKQIQELAGVAIDALDGAKGGDADKDPAKDAGAPGGGGGAPAPEGPPPA